MCLVDAASATVEKCGRQCAGESAASRTYPGGAVGCGGCAAPWHMFELVRPPGSSHGKSAALLLHPPNEVTYIHTIRL